MSHAFNCCCDDCHDLKIKLYSKRTAAEWDEIFSYGIDMNRFYKPTKPTPKKRYFLTLTRNPVYSKQEWLDDITKVCQQTLHEFISGTIEHLDTNIHAHVIVESKYNLDPKRYKKFYAKHPGSHNSERVKKIKWDNGTQSYISKENHPYQNLEDFIEYIQKLKEIN